MTTIRVFHTHIEVSPYKQSDYPTIENMMSKYDYVTHSRIPIGYFILGDVLYLPRGINTTLLTKHFGVDLTMEYKHTEYERIKMGEALASPKSSIQQNAIDFLTSSGDYVYTSRYSQLGLNLDTGDGKTYAAISAILKLKIKSIIITHREIIKNQWIKSFNQMTTVPSDRVYNIKGMESMNEIMNGKVDADIYCVNHQTITSYANLHGWDKIVLFFKMIKVGIKVIDESHKFFESTLMIDNFSNTYKSFYLTATFTRSDPAEAAIYRRAFTSLVRFGEDTQVSEEKRRHIVFVLVYFKSKLQYGYTPIVNTRYGFSSYKYIDYELKEEDQSLIKVLKNILETTSQLDGKTLILSPKKDSVNKIAEIVKKVTHEDCGTIYSNNSDEENNKNKITKRYISSTVKSVGEGLDIKGLRVLINLEPIGSKNVADQVRGRLREYSEDKDTYLFYPVDLSVPEISEMVKRIMPVMKKKCKEIKLINLTNL